MAPCDTVAKVHYLVRSMEVLNCLKFQRLISFWSMLDDFMHAHMNVLLW